MTWELDDLPERYRQQAQARLAFRHADVPDELLAMTEKQWTTHVVRYAKGRGWWRYHPNDSRRSERGWPDETFIRPPVMVFAELKSMDGKLTREQPHVMGLLRACGQDVYLWRPVDWPEVQRVLG